MSKQIPANPKCNRCLHYDVMEANCEVGFSNPVICGDGSTPSAGFAPADSTGPDAVPIEGHAQGGRVTASGGSGNIPMATARLGDSSELIALSERVVADMKKANRDGCYVHGRGMGQTTLDSYAHSAHIPRCVCPQLDSAAIAAKVHKGLSVRTQRMFTVEQIATHLEQSGALCR